MAWQEGSWVHPPSSPHAKFGSRVMAIVIHVEEAKAILACAENFSPMVQGDEFVRKGPPRPPPSCLLCMCLCAFVLVLSWYDIVVVIVDGELLLLYMSEGGLLFLSLVFVDGCGCGIIPAHPQALLLNKEADHSLVGISGCFFSRPYRPLFYFCCLVQSAYAQQCARQTRFYFSHVHVHACAVCLIFLGEKEKK